MATRSATWRYIGLLAFNDLTLLFGRQEVHPACEKADCWYMLMLMI